MKHQRYRQPFSLPSFHHPRAELPEALLAQRLVGSLGSELEPSVFQPGQRLEPERQASRPADQTSHRLALRQRVLRNGQLAVSPAEFVAALPVGSPGRRLERVPVLRLAFRLVGRTSHWRARQRRVPLEAQLVERRAEFAAALPAGSPERLVRVLELPRAFPQARRPEPGQQVFQVLEQPALGI